MLNKYALVFPGQGSQALGMLQPLSAESLIVQDTFNEASVVLGYDVWDLVQNGPENRLQLTEFTQPVMLTAGFAVWRVWNSKCSVKPTLLAGHSLGEYTALVCAQAINFQDALRIVSMRGRLMQEACPEGGAMAALVGLTNELVEKICHEAAQGEVLTVANYNSLGQTVLAGNIAAAERAVEQAKILGAKVAKILPVSVPAHSILMKPAVDQLQRVLEEITIIPPIIPVVHNVDVACHNDPKKIREVLVQQLCGSVHWVETIQLMLQKDITCVLECGPGKVLTGLNKRISNNIVADFIGDPQKMSVYAGDT